MVGCFGHREGKACTRNPSRLFPVPRTWNRGGDMDVQLQTRRDISTTVEDRG